MVRGILRGACLYILLSTWTRAELYSAIVQMEPLLETQERILNDLNDYITKEDVRLAVLKMYLKIYKREHENANKNMWNYIENPIKAFQLMNRLTTDLSNIDEYIKLGKEYTESVTLNHTDVTYPTVDDVSGAAQAIIRLQTIYRLDVHDLAEGWIKGVKYSNPMTAADCFGLSRALYIVKDFQNTVVWAKEALRKYKDKSMVFFKEADILEKISFSHYLMGNIAAALQWTRRLLDLDPRRAQARSILPLLTYKQNQRDQGANTQDTKVDTVKTQEKSEPTPFIASYESLCRGEQEVPTEIAKRLHCRYMTETHPFLRLAPFKVEQLFIDPDVLLFHDVISDDEIDIMKIKATPRLERAKVYHHETDEPVTAEYRTGMAGWVHAEGSPAVARVTRRVADVTGLSVTTRQPLQVVNYGIGGHYMPHFDFADKARRSVFAKIGGNRIATVLFYLSDVEQGGATVFTQLGLSVAPVKGAALFWLNLLPSGEGDYSTLHGACPVLRGSKWVCTKWIHQRGQELLKPCNLEYQQEGVGYHRAHDIPLTHYHEAMRRKV